MSGVDLDLYPFELSCCFALLFVVLDESLDFVCLLLKHSRTECYLFGIFSHAPDQERPYSRQGPCLQVCLRLQGRPDPLQPEAQADPRHVQIHRHSVRKEFKSLQPHESFAAILVLLLQFFCVVGFFVLLPFISRRT